MKQLSEDLLELAGIEEARETLWNTYIHDNTFVPRVSHILQQCQDNTWLINWAARIGFTKREYYQNRALEVGTQVHEAIDEYLTEKYTDKNISYLPDLSFADDEVKTAFGNFLYWEKNLNNNGYFIEDVVGLEIPVGCPWYAGTIDAIFRINGVYYIIDFKTSKQISPSYLLQAAAYMWIINNNYAPYLPHIGGIGIIRVDKKTHNKLNDLFLNCFDPAQNNMIKQYQECFMSYVESYYRTINIEFNTKQYEETYVKSAVVFENNKE